MSRISSTRWTTTTAITALLMGSAVPYASANQPSAGGDENGQVDGPSDANDTKAREHYRRGERYYSEGDYEAAIGEFQQAYDLSGRPKLLFNLANTHERLANYEQAIELLRLYAKSVPSYEHDAITRRIRNIEKRADEKARRDTSTPATPVKGTQPAVASDSSSPASNFVATSNSEPPASSPTLGWVLVGSGVALAAGGAVSGFLALNARGDAEDLCQQGRCPENAKSSIDDDKLYSLVSDIGIGLGAATALTGLILVWRHDNKQEQSPVSASLQSNGFNVSYSGSF